jgi:hypothetical protein
MGPCALVIVTQGYLSLDLGIIRPWTSLSFLFIWERYIVLLYLHLFISSAVSHEDSGTHLFLLGHSKCNDRLVLRCIVTELSLPTFALGDLLEFSNALDFVPFRLACHFHVRPFKHFIVPSLTLFNIYKSLL